MTKTITFSLDSSSIGKAVNELNKYIDELKTKLGLLVKELTVNGAFIATVKVIDMGAFDTGELANSIEGFYDESSHVGVIRAGAPYAFFVEYGTGIMGSNARHPELDGEWLPSGGWEYDHNHHGENGWFYISNRDGKRHWTRGQISSPFMYETSKDLQELARQLASKYFGT